MESQETPRDGVFLAELKTKTEAKRAAEDVINPTVYGFQFQQGTKWNPALSPDEIKEYEDAINARFTNDFRAMLRHVNGTDIPNLNVYGNTGAPHTTAFTLYAFRRDLHIVKERIAAFGVNRDEIAEVLLEYEQFTLACDAVLLPIYGHRYLVCAGNRTQSRVLSIVGTDVITYGLNLQSFLIREFLK